MLDVVLLASVEGDPVARMALHTLYGHTGGVQDASVTSGSLSYLGAPGCGILVWYSHTALCLTKPAAAA